MRKLMLVGFVLALSLGQACTLITDVNRNDIVADGTGGGGAGSGGAGAVVDDAGVGGAGDAGDVLSDAGVE